MEKFESKALKKALEKAVKETTYKLTGFRRKPEEVLTDLEKKELIKISHEINNTGYTVVKLGDRYFSVKELG